MEITPATAVAMNQATTQNQLAMGVLKKALDVEAQVGAGLVKMLSQQAGVGQRIDLYA